MIFMSQSSITDTTLSDEWSKWYAEHLEIMLTVNGIDSAERFVTDSEGWPFSLAMYTIRSPEIFQDPYYLEIRGMGSWAPLIDKRYYQRNLFSGREVAPKVSKDEVLLVTNQSTPISDFLDIEWDWLKSVGLDQSTPYRGIKVMKSESFMQLDHVTKHFSIGVYKPT
jgi:hypothetical protein